MKAVWNCFKSYKIGSILIAVMVLAVIASPANAGLWVAPNIFDVNIIEGCTLTRNLTVGNDGVEDLDFMIRTRQVGSSGDLVGIDGMSAGATESVVSSIPKDHDFTVAGNTPYKPGELIVRFGAKANGQMRSMADKNQVLSSVGGGNIKRNFNIVPGLTVVTLPAGMTVEDALQQFNGADGILYAEPDYEVQICSTFPDDTRFNDLWGMHNTGQTGGTADADIDAPEAWDIGTGSSEIIVAVIDTGVGYTHPDLAANMWVNEAEYNGTPGVDDDGNGYIDDIYGYDFRNNDGNPMDDHYHGTHCAGTIGGIGNNSEGVAGVSWKVRIMALKFISSGGSGYTDDAIKCVEYSVLMGANLSSNSWGGGGYSQGLKDAIDAAGVAGILFVAAAGNDNEDTDVHPHYPSSYDSESLISVMATDDDDNKASFSNYGMVSVDLGAPGVDILSCQLGGGYKYASGTSMATPHVAGTCALLWSMNPAMSNDEVKDILLRTADQIPALAGKCVSEGRLNLYQAILETKAPWIEIDPETGIIGPGGSNDISVTFDAIELAPGLYEAEIVIISNDPCSPETIPVTMTVNADDLQVAPAEGFESSGTEGGPFEPECVVYTLTNINGTESVNWTALNTEDWLQIIPSEGLLGPGEVIDINVCISANADLLDPNLYTEILTFQNTDSGSINPRSISLTVKPPDCFTESFDDSGSDLLSGLMVTFSPDGSIAYYEACRERVDEFPTDPNGGKYVELWDDDFVKVRFGSGKKVLFYGKEYGRLYIGSNGYITFGDGDTEFDPSLENHFSMPRISGVFADLDPPDDHCISKKKLDDRVVITFENVPIFGDKDVTNSFQIEMFYVDGTIRITWLDVAETACVAGLSRGRGLPPVFFEESDLNGYPPCWPWCDLNRDYFVNFADFAMFAKHWLDEDCGIPYWCGKSDIDFSSSVDFADLGFCADNWLVEVEKWWLWPVSHWKFDEGEGDIAYDSVGGNDGTVNGATWTTGQIDGALSFDGDGDYVEVNDQPVFNNMQAITISVWVKADAFPNLYPRIVNKAKSTSDSDRSFDLYIKQSTSNVHFSVAGQYIKSSGTLAIGVWYHIAATFDNSLDKQKIYINGVLDTSVSNLGNFVDTTGYNVYIGSFDPSILPSRWWDGSIDDVRIYDRAISAEEIMQLYEEGRSYKATNPNPADGATGEDPNGVLSWTPGKDVISHDVYFGTDYNDVNDANTFSEEYKGNQEPNSYNPNGLDYITTYYWRIDEVNGPSVWKGDVWSFTTWSEPNSYLVSRWKFDEGEGDIAYDSVGSNDGTIYGATWTAGQINGALSFDGVDDYVDLGDIDEFEFGENDFSISVWICSRDYSGGGGHIITKYYWGGSQRQWHLTHRASGVIRFYTNPTGASAAGEVLESVSIAQNTWTFVTAVRKGSAKYIYLNGELDNTGTTAGVLTGQSAKVYIGVVDSPEGLCGFFNGTIDDVRVYDRALSSEEIWQLYQGGLINKASNPNPADMAVDVDPNTVLSWSPGKDAISHDVYLGTDFNDVNDAAPDSNEFMGNQEPNSYNPNGLDYITTYYWRIDEVTAGETIKGDIWIFTTSAEFDPNLNLVSLWKFDEGEGDIAYDSVGGNDGTIYGATWTAGQINGALSFDGMDDYVGIADSPVFDTDTITVAAWVKGPAQEQGVIVSQWDSNFNERAWNTSTGSIEGSGLISQYHTAITDNGEYYYGHRKDYQTVATAFDDSWHFVAFTFDGPDTNLKLYIDGNLQTDLYKRCDDPITRIHNSTADVRVGCAFANGIATRFFDGTIDDVRIYDRVLSAGEIWELYQKGLNN